MDERDDGAREVVVKPVGELDMATIAPVRAEVEEGLADGALHVVFDLADVTFLDSSGLALLAEAAGRGAQITVRNPPPIVVRLIEATGMTDIVVVEQ